MEKLFDLHSTGRYDCIIVDTPPTRNALDFLDAPKRLTDFLDGKFLKMFLSPGLTATKTIGRMAAFGTGLFMKAAGRITGAGVLDDLAEFFQSFEGMYEGFKNRAQLVYKLLASGDAAFVVVSSGEPTALREARYFVQRLAKEGMPLAGLVLNRVTPVLPEDLAALAARVGEDDRERLLAGDDEQRAVAGMLGLLDRSAQVHARQQRNIESGLHGLDPRTLVEVPEMPSDVHDLEGLDAIGEHLIRS